MILFLDEEQSYLNWVTHHRTGFVLDCLRHPTKAHLVLHRATCADIKQSRSRHTHWTTGKHMKACSLRAEELVDWARDQTEHEPAICPHCSPHEPPASDPHLTRLDRDILDYVLEIASYHMEADDHDYHLTLGMVARCLGKTAGQLMAALGRLVEGEMLTTTVEFKPGVVPSSRSVIMPTTKGLRTIAAYDALDEEQLAAELRKLTTE